MVNYVKVYKKKSKKKILRQKRKTHLYFAPCFNMLLHAEENDLHMN